jgi:hypothetical protein
MSVIIHTGWPPPKVVGHHGFAAEALKDLLAKALWATSDNDSKPTRGYRALTETRLEVSSAIIARPHRER